MRYARLLLITVVAATVAVPVTSDARPRVLGVLRSLLGGVVGLHIGHHAIHRRHAVAQEREKEKEATPPKDTTSPKDAAKDATPPADTRQSATRQSATRQSATQDAGPQLPPPPVSLSLLPQADFATIDDEFFGYVFWPADYDTKFWAHGERDMIQAVFTKGDGTPTTCGQPSPTRATALIEKIEQTLRPNEAQRGALEELRTALTASLDGLSATCRDVEPLTPTARLKWMQDRLYAVRNAALSIRTPLSNFYDALSDEQKTQFGTSDIVGASETQVSGPSIAVSHDATQICAAQAQAAYAWPSALIGRRVRPNQQQRASLDALPRWRVGGCRRVDE